MVKTRFDASPEQALDAIAKHTGLVLVDLDETLYLRNSTEDFIGSAWPAPLAFLLMKVLEVLQPWRVTGGAKTRDVWRVAIIGLLFPWTFWTWRLAAKRLAHDATNLPLLDCFKTVSQPKAIVTLGFRPIVSPLVAAMGMGDIRLVAMRPWRFRDRLEGKMRLTVHELGKADVQAALLVTDSVDDLDLLEACARPFRVIWPAARFHEAFSNAYIPGLYTIRIKRGKGHIFHSILKEDFALWVLASLALASNPVTHIIGLALLSFSFWTIYECGYVDNDRVAASHEEDPVLASAFFDRPVRTSDSQAWIWAIASGALALVVLRSPGVPAATDFLAWYGLLLIMHYWYRVYNRLDKSTRVWLFGGLQMFRAAAPIVLVPMTLVGILAVFSHALARWLPYYVYRRNRQAYDDGDAPVTKMYFFGFMFLLLGWVIGWSALWSYTTVAILLWMVVLARRPLKAMWRAAHRIDRA